MRKSALLIVMAAMTLAARNQFPSSRTVNVCVDRIFNAPQLVQAEFTASRMFGNIGVDVRWHMGLKGCPPKALVVTFRDRAPQNEQPGSLAYATPYEGIHIVVYSDRVTGVAGPGSAMVTQVLGHVFVHEITHLLQATSTHSETGVMKAHWEPTDFCTMMRQSLPFTDDDVALILSGLKTRAAAALPD